MANESQDDRERRLEKLWKTLDTREEGQLDLNGLKKGLRKMDHPLKNADSLLKDVLKAVDTSGDGQIQYNEFRVFVEHAERELWQLFESIDRDHNGELDKTELKLAFSKAGLAISNSKLDQFFAEVDTNHDGVISFEEWRDFLLFIPGHTPNLRAILSYYETTATVNMEGDVHINEILDGLGITTEPSLLSLFFQDMKYSARIFYTRALWKPKKLRRWRPRTPKPLRKVPKPLKGTCKQQYHLMIHHDDSEMEEIPITPAHERLMTFRVYFDWIRYWRHNYPYKKYTDNYVQSPGYFVAGGIAGAVSRTVTAPLDRLKVYLIAQTSPKEGAIRAVKQGSPLKAILRLGNPLVQAMTELWRVGGMRSLFAGNGLNVVKVMPESAIKFGAYEAAKKVAAELEGHGDPKKLHPGSQFVAGGAGGMIAQCFVYPLDTLKFRMQCETVEGGLHGNKLILDTAHKMWTSGGLHSYYRGLPMGLAGMFPYAAIDLTTFETLKHWTLVRTARLKGCHEEDVKLNNFQTGFIGAFSGAISATIVYPMNLLRTRLQAQGTVLHPPTYTGIWDVTKRTLKSEGFPGLFKGVTPNLLKVAPAVSISYLVYENSKTMMGLS